GHSHTHAHPADVVPAADFVGGLLRLQIEIDDVLHEPSNTNSLFRAGPGSIDNAFRAPRVNDPLLRNWSSEANGLLPPDRAPAHRVGPAERDDGGQLALFGVGAHGVGSATVRASARCGESLPATPACRAVRTSLRCKASRAFRPARRLRLAHRPGRGSAPSGPS